MGLRVIRPGPSATVQDRGRVGYRSFGVPVGGAFDLGSHDLANALLGNEPGASTLELTLVGGIYRAETTLGLGLAGAPMGCTIRDPSGRERTLHVPQTTTIDPGEDLIIGGTPRGARTYLSVRGGWQTPPILGSRSTEERLRAGDLLPAEPGSTLTRRPCLTPEIGLEDDPIRVIDGPDPAISEGDSRLLESGEFLVSSKADRMGLRLEGPRIDREGPDDRASAPVSPGAVQIAGGRPIVLGVAGGTMGGYLHLAHVISADLERLAQLRPGDRLRFRRIEVEEARRIDRADRRERARWLARIALIQGFAEGLD
ncbi:biotin-dependent carboxyltransferase family protein [Tundrisphaera lichenicola]|uniref:5-oxoprolinase subunit C family protein n=1 Tax=Tundrisphaera lichenicola TaxID=2029860 RepID=UPI003EB92E1A